jgi:hypothetical protein
MLDAASKNNLFLQKYELFSRNFRKNRKRTCDFRAKLKMFLCENEFLHQEKNIFVATLWTVS